MWILLLVLHLVGLGGFNLVLRRSLVAKSDPWKLATVMQTGIAIPMVPFLLVHPVDISDYDFQSGMYVLITALLVIALHATNVKALQYLETGVFSVLYNLRVVFTTFLGILFLNEAIVPLQIVGGLLIFMAILVVKQKGERSLTIRGIWWGISAGIVISVLNLFEKTLIDDIGYLEYSIPVMVLAAVIMWVALLARERTVNLGLLRTPEMGKLMVLRALSAYGLTLAFATGGKLSVVNYISSLGVIVIILLGALFLNERDYFARKMIAGGVALVGLTVILIAQVG